MDGAGNVYVGDLLNDTIRKLSVPAVPAQAGLTGTSAVAVTANLTGLTEGTPYYFRAVGSNSGGMAVGTIATFKTASNLGKVDPTFGNQGEVSVGGAPEDIITYPDGRFLVSQAYFITRYTADGQRDLSFGPLGSVNFPGGGVNADQGNIGVDVALQTDGKIIASLSPASGGGKLARFNSDGSLDTTFGTAGLTAPITITVAGQQVPLQVLYGNNLHSLALLPDGRTVIAGYVTVPNVGQYTGLAMFLPNGTLDPSFNGNGTLYVPPDSGDSFHPNLVLNLAVSNNQILFAALDQNSGAFRLYQFNLDGTRNTPFGSNGEITVNSQLYGYDDPAMAVGADGKILLAYLAVGPTTLLSGQRDRIAI